MTRIHRRLAGTDRHARRARPQLPRGDRAVTDDRHVADGYRMLATTLGVAFDTYLFAEPSRPQFVELNTPFRRDRRWGGDNTDAYYSFCPVDPQRRYRITGNRGDSVYFSLTAYNEPSPGAWSDKVVHIVNDDDARASTPMATSRFDLGPLPGVAVLVTRDYQIDPLTGRPVSWRIEALDEPDPIRHGDDETAAALRACAAWLRTMFAILPLAVGVRGRRRSQRSATRPPRLPTNSAIRTRCPTPTSAGPPATPATPTAASSSRTTRRWWSPTGRRPAASGTWWSGTSSWRPQRSPTGGLGQRPHRGAQRGRHR